VKTVTRPFLCEKNDKRDTLNPSIFLTQERGGRRGSKRVSAAKILQYNSEIMLTCGVGVSGGEGTEKKFLQSSLKRGG